MSEYVTRNRLVVAVVALATIALLVAAAGGVLTPLFGDDRPDDPTTEETVGYVEGYWYDDELAVDDREGAVVEDDELEPVVYRSMARVEQLRELTFEDEVSVEVISRETFQAENDDLFVDLDDDERHKQNITYEATFMVDRETDAATELEAMYGGTVAGYYDPASDEIVVVAEDADEPELDEIVLGHELLHALQDQHFDLTSYDRETIDQDNAKNGLIEGDAVWVEEAYDERCGDEWDCLEPTDDDPAQSAFNWGIYLTAYQPYSDGPEYVDHLREDGGWDAVDAAYDDPPASSSTVIHHEDRDPVDVDHEDRSSDAWEPLAVDGDPRTETVGEAGMVAMFTADAFDATRGSVIDDDAVVGVDPTRLDYDQPYTDGWAGDELVTYVDADGNATDDESGFVWETEWRSERHAQEFATGYLELLEHHDADAVADRQDTYVVDAGYPGAYFLERDGASVTIVRAPSVGALDGVAEGAAPEGEDELERVAVGENEDAETNAGDDEVDDPVPGVAVPGAIVAVALGAVTARARARRSDARSAGSDRTAASATGVAGNDRGRARA